MVLEDEPCPSLGPGRQECGTSTLLYNLGPDRQHGVMERAPAQTQPRTGCHLELIEASLSLSSKWKREADGMLEIRSEILASPL